MNESDVSKQVQQMVQFIRQEAEEKANEISVSAEEVCMYASFLSLAEATVRMLDASSRYVDRERGFGHQKWIP
jgi:vacuolar-type H+-ATPase subunit E/Vma4